MLAPRSSNLTPSSRTTTPRVCKTMAGHDRPQKPILISGAGLASLLLAQALHRAAIPFRVYERDASLSFRAQGYRLRLSDVGLDAIESALGPEKWQKFWQTTGKTGGAGFTARDAITGEALTHGGPPAKGAPPPKADAEARGAKMDLGSRGGKIVGISRGDMRKIFLEGCEDHVRWSHHVTGYELTSSGVRALFADGTKSEEGEMLVGGEGIHSAVAQQVSRGAIRVFDTGARGIHGQAPAPAFRGLGEGVWRVQDPGEGGVAIITNVRPNDLEDPDVRYGWTMTAKPGVIRAPKDDYSIVGKIAAEIAKGKTANWHRKFQPLFDQMEEAEAAFWKITISDPRGVPEWENERRVTVIGDAVHAMTPAGGNGANTAVRDSALLGRLLVEAKGKAEEGLTKRYEQQMRVYGSEMVKKSYELAHTAFGVDVDENTPTI